MRAGRRSMTGIPHTRKMQPGLVMECIVDEQEVSTCPVFEEQDQHERHDSHDAHEDQGVDD